MFDQRDPIWEELQFASKRLRDHVSELQGRSLNANAEVQRLKAEVANQSSRADKAIRELENQKKVDGADVLALRRQATAAGKLRSEVQTLLEELELIQTLAQSMATNHYLSEKALRRVLLGIADRARETRKTETTP